jgi:predicted nucleic acid-binding protein
MPRALVDTSVLFAAAYQRDAHHEAALPILQGFDDGTLPEPVVIDHVLAETLNGLTARVGHEAAVEYLERLEANSRFHLATPRAEAVAMAKGVFRETPALSYVDAWVVTQLRRADLEYLYAFDADFDRIDGLTRLLTATNPYDPEQGS